MMDARYKQIMTDLGMPESQSLLSALRQVANEVGQEATRNESKRVKARAIEVVGWHLNDYNWEQINPVLVELRESR